MTTRIITGDCREILPTLAADSFDCVVTSPPYWGLRNYGVDGQIGLEPKLSAYLETMVAVCREVRRVLKPQGTFWLNVGDSYASAWVCNRRNVIGNGSLSAGKRAGRPNRLVDGLKEKDLCMVPNRLAILLQEDGWFVRSEIVWAKPNPMPESVTDRPTSAHEKVWLLTKNARYFYDAEAIREHVTESTVSRLAQSTLDTQHGSTRGNGGQKSNGNMKAVINEEGRKAIRAATESRHRSKIPGGQSLQAVPTAFRNARNVWPIASQPFSGAHFATMPPALVERCIKAGCPQDGHVLDPFGGAGTTGLVADRLGRHATLIELNPAYAQMGGARVKDDAPLFAEITP
jgi:DNA modification methylase